MATLQIRRGTSVKLGALTPKAGELVLDTDKYALFVGNGSTAGGINITNSWVDYSVTTVTASVTLTPGSTFTRADVYLQGLIQVPGYSYTIANSVITFAESVPAGTLVYCKLYR